MALCRNSRLPNLCRALRFASALLGNGPDVLIDFIFKNLIGIKTASTCLMCSKTASHRAKPRLQSQKQTLTPIANNIFGTIPRYDEHGAEEQKLVAVHNFVGGLSQRHQTPNRPRLRQRVRTGASLNHKSKGDLPAVFLGGGPSTRLPYPVEADDLGDTHLSVQSLLQRRVRP